MNDITEHKWSDEDITRVDIISDGSIDLIMPEHPNALYIKEPDAIAIAKHFGIIKDIDGQQVTIHKATVTIEDKKRNHEDGDYSYLCGSDYCRCTQ